MLNFLFYFKVLFILVVGMRGDIALASSADTLITPAEAQEAKVYKDNLFRYLKPSASKVEALKRQVSASNAYQKRSFYEASSWFGQVLKDIPKDLSAWVTMADALNQVAMGANSDDHKNALMAAFNAYHVATTPIDKAAVIYLLSNIDHKYHEVLKKEYARFSRQEIEDRFNALITDYPKVFDVYEIEQPETSSVGTVCLSLSKPLLKVKDFHYEDYVTINPQVKDFSVVAKGNRLCISGLAFGSAYKITLKKGLAGEREYKLAEDRTFSVLVSHRKPSIVFRERGYILPAQGPQVLPLKAINVAQVHIKVLRIPSPNLPNEINQNSFLTQLNSWKIDELKDGAGELIGEGTFDTRGNLDEAVVKGLPIDQILVLQL